MYEQIVRRRVQLKLIWQEIILSSAVSVLPGRTEEHGLICKYNEITTSKKRDNDLQEWA